MKNISSEARCTNANGRDISTEMREPFGSGMDHPREAVAIKGFPSASLILNKDASEHVLRAQSRFRATMQTMPTMRIISSVEETLHIQCTGRPRAGQAYPRTAVHNFAPRLHTFVNAAVTPLRLSSRLYFTQTCHYASAAENESFRTRALRGVRNLLFLLVIAML